MQASDNNLLTKNITYMFIKFTHRLFPTVAKSTFRLQASYHENVIDHYENPRNVGSLDKNKKNVGTGLVGAPACGDVMKLQIELN